MITDQSIQNVRDAIDIVKVAGRYVELKRQGSSLIGCCPFHNEKTGSFHVNAAKEIYKCFGCGEGGDAISMVMKLEHLDFIAAIRHLADLFKVHIEETEQRPEDKEVAEKKLSFYDLNAGVLKKWREHLGELPADHWAILEISRHRELSKDTVIEFQLGFAPDRYDYLTPSFRDSGYLSVGEEIGLITIKEEKSYDTFRNRIIFPIHDERGQVIGFGGRKPEDGNSNNPKYLNSKASMIYRKEQVFYGLYQAQNEIRKSGIAIIVEGYIDVLAMHQHGVCNAIAPCGTALTESHGKKLKKLCNTVILMNDGDAAGNKATLKAIDILASCGLRVEVCELPDGQDPDSLARSMEVVV